jgi:ATP-dependent DNA helicase RecG
MPSLLLTDAEIRELLKRREGQFHDFKSQWDRSVSPPRPLERRKVRDLVAEYLAAFANADGGTLVLGAEGDGSPTGLGYPEEAIEEILAVASRRLRPHVEVQSQTTEIDRCRLLLIHVPPSPEAIMVEGNGFPFRVGDRVLKEPQEAINQRKQTLRRVGYERLFRAEASVDDLDLELATQVLGRSFLAGRSVMELLERFGLVVGSSRSWRVTNAALLLFGRSPLARWHPRTGIRFFRVDGTVRRLGAERNVSQLERIELPLVKLIPEAHRFLAGQIRRSERLHDLFFRETPEYPEHAWQEALVNAVAHRDYSDQGREIEVWLYEDRLEISSPGELVPPVTLESLRAARPVHASRNPLLVRPLVEAGIMREEGEGIPRIFEEMERSFLHPPALDLEAGSFRVTLRNEPVFAGVDPDWDNALRRQGLKPSQIRALHAFPKEFTSQQYRELNRLDPDRAQLEIEDLVRVGIVGRRRAGPSRLYFHLTEAWAASRAWMGARLPVLREFFRDHGMLKNADYRQLFGVDRTAAAQELRRLVGEGVLLLVGERRGAHYRPGPNL